MQNRIGFGSRIVSGGGGVGFGAEGTGRWFGMEVSEPELCIKGLLFLLLPRANILGHKGEVAEEFGVIMKALWSGLYKIISARDFKITIGKINDQFSGCEQQDSQELLLFLMDGLHEDLNKVGV